MLVTSLSAPMSVLMFALVAWMAVQTRAGEMSSCADDSAVETGSCGGDAISSSSFIQAAAQLPKAGRAGKKKERAAANGVAAIDTVPTAAVTISQDFCRPAAGAHIRVRKNIFDLAVADWENFKVAFQGLYSKGSYKKFIVEHTMHYEDDPENGFFKDHAGAYGFLAFHRGMIQDLETELMNEADDCNMAFPYWDWSLDVGIFKDNEIWTDTYMGNGEGCVTSGLPGGWTYDSPGVENPCVERHVKNKRALFDSRKLAIKISDTPDFETFVRDIEAIHNTAHGAIGGRPGNMANKVGMASPSDPMFFLHHAFIDSLYFRWQEIHDDTSATLLRASLRPFTGRYDESFGCVYMPLHRSLADDVNATCVSYEPAVNAHPPNSALLQTFASDSACVALQRQIQRNECSAEELRKLACIAAPECLLDELAEFEDSKLFVPDEKKEHVFEKELMKASTDTICLSYSDNFSPAELHHCYKCDYKCVGDSKDDSKGDYK